MSAIILSGSNAGSGGAPTPSSGKARIFLDSVSEQMCHRDDAGRYWGRAHRCASAAQGAGFSSDTYVTDSGLLIPSFSLQAGTRIVWNISASKTAAGTAAPVYTIRIGGNQTTADTSRLAITGPAQTAAADVGLLTIIVTVRSVSATGVIQGSTFWRHNGAATGFANNDAGGVEATSAGFDNTALSGQYIGLSINGGASAAWTLTQVQGEVAY